MKSAAILLIFLFGCQNNERGKNRPIPRESVCREDKLPGTLPDFLNACGPELKGWGIDIHVENKILSGPGGKFPIHYFRSRAEADFYVNLADRSRAKIMSDAYFEYLAPFIKPEDEKDLGQIISEFSIYWGAQKISSTKLLQELQDAYPGLFNRHRSNFSQNWIKFFDKVRSLQRHLYTSSTQKHELPLVAIVTGPHGGGHIATANEIRDAITDSKHLSPVLIDECLDYQDPLDTLTHGQVSSCKAFGEYWLKENNPRKAKILFHLNWLVSYYIIPNQREQLRRHLSWLNPDLIISSVHHLDDISNIGYSLEKPTLIAITDFDFPEKQWTQLNYIDSRYTRYLTPRTDKLFFRRMFMEYPRSRLKLEGTPTRSYTLYDQFYISNHSNNLQDLISKFPELAVFKILGYPVSPKITYPKDASSIFKARQYLKLNLDPDRKVVAISLGGAPSEEKIENVLGKIIHNSDKLDAPIQLVILSAGNQLIESASKRIMTQANISMLSDMSDQKIIAKVLPRLDRTQIAALNNATDVFLSKAGGATSAELLQSSTYYLRAFPIEHWEAENAIYLERLGLSITTPAGQSDTLHVDYHPYLTDPTSEELIDGINKILSNPRILGETVEGYLPYHRPNLIREIESMIHDFQKP